MKTVFFTVIISCFAFPFLGDCEPMRHDGQAWLQATVFKPLTVDKKYVFALEVQPRIGDDFSHIERLLIRPSIGYNVSERLSLWGGYGWTPTFINQSYEHAFRDEHRVWQQALYTHQLGESEFSIQHRARLEERFVEDTSGVAVRLRYLVRGSHPFECGGRTGVTAYNEYFLNFNTIDNGPKRGFDRNRFFVGPYFLDGANRYEIGYLGEYGNHFRDGDRMINGMLVSATINLG